MNKKIKSIAVFCGSSDGLSEKIQKETRELGGLLGRENIRLVYGGARVGLMGMLADAALEAGGEVVGVLPEFLSAKEIAHEGLTELHIVQSMHERKLKMQSLVEGVIALPGGYGTLEELFEFITWSQLGLHDKPTGILNVEGYYDHLLLLLDHMKKTALLRGSHREMMLVAESPYDLLQMFKVYEPPKMTKWITSDKT